MKYATCDLQLMNGKSETYVIKEFSIFKPQKAGEFLATTTFGPPYSAKKLKKSVKELNDFVTVNRHGLEWEEGERPYSTLVSTLECMTARFAVLYVKGGVKTKLLQSLLPGKIVKDLLDYRVPPLDKLPVLSARCHNVIHSTTPFYACAAKNARRLGLWLEFFLAALGEGEQASAAPRMI